MSGLYLGVDVGAETIKFVAIEKHGGRVSISTRLQHTHNKDPHTGLATLLSRVDLVGAKGIAATGRLQRVLRAESVPAKAAMRRGVRLIHPELEAVTIISVGAHGFSVLELGAHGEEWFQQNARCSQGTGNFLTQLVKRFGLSVAEASELCDDVVDPASLSGRCPVILKTDMTHLANKGESRARILAGLYDAVCENVLTLVRPRLAPRDVVLIGGVAQSARVRRTIERWLDGKGMRLVSHRAEHDVLEALGAASHAMEHPGDVSELSKLLITSAATELERVPALRDALTNVRRVPRVEMTSWDQPRWVYVGLDIGSTGSKAVAIDETTGEALWESYLNTEGAPVDAAQRLVHSWVDRIGEHGLVRGFGVTGSGREVVGSLLRTCYGDERVFVMNEIAAHAEGALSIDSEVDTIFEIGGQDAKYIRLEGGRVVDAAMNEACSAGTGSFIAEQGAKFEGIGDDVVRLGQLAEGAGFGISLGQHCSVFMAEVIDEAITQGIERDAIIAGLYDSVIQNYLNRVKGTRTVGKRIFCQGMPFSSAALAAAVARQTGREVVVPPNPGTIGALGIALLTRSEMKSAEVVAEAPLDPHRFMSAEVVSKETFVCKSTKGCGGSGNLCRIDRLTTRVSGVKQKFLWGGNCSLYDRGAGRAKLPDLSPDPFREREGLVEAILRDNRRDPGSAQVIAMTDEFALKGMLPLFVAFLHNLGFDCRVTRNAGGKALRRGIEGARVPYCAPMQMYHGVFFDIADSQPDYAFIPMLQELPPVRGEVNSTLCPVVQAGPDLVGSLIEDDLSKRRILRPVIRFGGEGYDGKEFTDSMRILAEQLGALHRFPDALKKAVDSQRKFEDDCLDIGTRALAYAREKSVVPVVVLGRPYTIYNDVLNSNVPTLLRSLGALAIPVDCIPVPDDIPRYDDQYWGYTQRNLRAAAFVRRTPGVYSVFCSNYACGPDSFTLHFYSYIMQGKPCAVVETDGHSGDAGTKTRMEAFLYCVDTDVRAGTSELNRVYDLKAIEDAKSPADRVKADQTLLLIPRMGTGAEVAAACLRGEGFRCETLPMPDREDVRVGRRYTSGKECVPMMLTTGSLLNRIEKDRHTDEKFTFAMPTANGPCRFGVYNVLHKVILEQTGWSDRVDVFSPDDGDYFRETSAEFTIKLWCGFVAYDMLEAMLYDVRPVERRKGAANAIYKQYKEEIVACMERHTKGTAMNATIEVMGRMWGLRELLTRAAKEMAAIKNRVRDVPSVAVVGEIYVRLDPFANDFIIEKLEERGIRARFAPFVEWLEYTQWLAEQRVLDKRMRHDDNALSIGLTGVVQRASMDVLYDVCAKALDWGARTTIPATLDAAHPYLDSELTGEACLTLGGPIHEFRQKLVQGVVVVGPHECMPCRIAEAQYGKVAEDMNIPYLAMALNGDPLDTEELDRFAYDIHEAHRKGLGRDLGTVFNKMGGTDARPSELADDPSLVPLRLSAESPAKRNGRRVLD
jgi:activator of 2-hydroxyglutaryl-CoA dehydratase/predicted nucleotide-binding protein (sugar kinase/HSP70/actin superfamily)